MFGLDDSIASLSDGTSLLVVVAVAVLLGLRHATDPDHVVAVSTLVVGRGEAAGRRAARLGLAWGSGHALTLFAFGLPIVLFRAYLPESVQQGAETAIGVLIVALAVWLLVRWRRGALHAHASRTRSPLQAFSIGLLHGVGGSAGVGILLVATIQSHAYAVVALALLALFTAVSMTVLSSGFGLAVGGRVTRFAPALGVAALGFGLWYALGALSLAPYVL